MYCTNCGRERRDNPTAAAQGWCACGNSMWSSSRTPEQATIARADAADARAEAAVYARLTDVQELIEWKRRAEAVERVLGRIQPWLPLVSTRQPMDVNVPTREEVEALLAEDAAAQGRLAHDDERSTVSGEMLTMKSADDSGEPNWKALAANAVSRLNHATHDAKDFWRLRAEVAAVIDLLHLPTLRNRTSDK